MFKLYIDGTYQMTGTIADINCKITQFNTWYLTGYNVLDIKIVKVGDAE